MLDNMSFQTAAPLACASITVWGGLIRANLDAGESVAIFGGGGRLGHLGIQLAKALGLQVITIDLRDESLSLARECGADTVINAQLDKEKVVEEVKKVIGGQGADGTLNISEHESTAPREQLLPNCTVGVLIQITQPTNVNVLFAELVFHDIRFHGSLTNSRGACQVMLDFVSKNNIKVKTNAFNGIKGLPKAIELAHFGKMEGKPVILIDNEAFESEKISGLAMS